MAAVAHERTPLRPCPLVLLPRLKTDDALMGALVNGFVVLDFAYVAAFNLLGDEIRIALAGALFAAQAGLALASLLLRFAPWRFLLLAAALMLPLSWLVRLALEGRGVAFSAAFRDLFPFLFAIWILAYRHRLDGRVVLFGCCLVLCAGFAFAAFAPPVFRNDVARAAPFTGGPDGLNSSALLCACLVLLADQLRRRRVISWPGFAAISGSALVLLVGYRISAAFLFTALYFLVLLALNRALPLRLRLGGAIVVLCAGVVVVAEHELRTGAVGGSSPVALNQLGSGRIGVWEDRLLQLRSRDGIALAFGTGPDSDNAFTRQWSWEAKPAHNDLVSILTETGLLGLGGVVLFLATLVRALGLAAVPFLAAAVAGSVVTVGLYHVPSVTLFFWLALALAAAPPVRSRARRAEAATESTLAHEPEGPPLAADWWEADGATPPTALAEDVPAPYQPGEADAETPPGDDPPSTDACPSDR